MFNPSQGAVAPIQRDVLFHTSSRNVNLPEPPLISIVDDDASVREATRGLVRSLGYVAMTFSSAEEFLKSDRLQDTSCLITDVQMPGLSGVDLQRRLSEQGHCMPIIFITAFPSVATKAHALKAGAIGYLSKPFSEDSLIACLDTALNNSKG
jgi:FixJ family two-component response regulator